MHRLALVLFGGGILLLLASLRAPASPAGPPAAAGLAGPAYFDQESSAVLTAVSEEVARLKRQLAGPLDVPVPSRDPFSFGRPPERPVPPADLAPLPAMPPPPVSELPRLVAVASSSQADAPAYRAFVAFGGVVREVRAGETVGPFLVQTVGFDAIELLDAERGTRHTIVLR